MDACTYESITGLKNYYGFKSLLKNGGITGRYACDDDTIVFNRIEQHVQASGGLLLSSNQVGVLLNFNSSLAVSPTQYWQESIRAYSVDGTIFTMTPNSQSLGQVFIDRILFGIYFGENSQVTFAIFDLY